MLLCACVHGVKSEISLATGMLSEIRDPTCYLLIFFFCVLYCVGASGSKYLLR